MLGWAIAFVLAAIVVAILGFTETATTLGLMANVLFWVFVAGCVWSMLLHFFRPSRDRQGALRR